MYETSTHMLAYTHKFAPDTNKRTHLANRFNICRLDFFFRIKTKTPKCQQEVAESD